MLEDKRFEIIVPICSHCEKQKNTKAGWTHNKPTLDNGENVEIDLQPYYYHNCNHKFSTKFNEEESGELDDNEIKKS
jgi:thymidine kinase